MLRAKMGGVAPLNASLRLGGDVQSKWLGDWQVGRSYAPLDKVSRGGSSYVCVRPCTAVDPLVDVGDGVEGQYWVLIAAKGKSFTYDMFTEEQLEALRGRAFTYEDFTKEQLEALRGPAGESITDISRTAGTGAPGTIDTYTVTTSTGRTWPLYMYNGKDGQGAGDMTAAVYDPTGKKTDVFAYVDQKVANITTPDVSGQIGSHNTDGAAHTDIRALIAGLTTRMNALADSDDTTLDQMSELVAYIKSNKSLIDAITTAKVSVGDIVNDLVTNNASKPLSAAQGVALKALVDAAAAAASAAKSTAEGKADASHNQAASTITAGTFAGQVVANSAGQTPGAKLIRNSKLMAASDFDAVTNWSSHITNGEIVWRYE